MLGENNGFTLIEVLTVIFVVTAGIVAALTLVQNSVASSRFASRRLTATYLAQEGIEITRSIRDNNWLKIISWDHGFIEGNHYRVDYQDLESNPQLESYQDQYLKIDGAGYTCDGSNQTPFKREIIIMDKNDLDGDDAPDKMKVKVKVRFDFRSQQHTVSVQENLYNWWQP